MQPDVTIAEVLACVRDGKRMQSGNQGSIHVGKLGERKILVKAAGATGVVSWLCRRFLRNEYRVYCRLAGLKGIPHCYGLFDGRYLVLEYVESKTLRHATIKDRASFYEEFLTITQSFHERGVTHGDLKRKDNILVVDERHPYLIDFGVASVHKRGFHPLNRLWHNFSRQHDLNAWVKHKYDRKFQDISPDDAQYYRPMLAERLARLIKSCWVNSHGTKKASVPETRPF